MKETRVQKWKAYRESLIKQDTPIENGNSPFTEIKVKDEKPHKKSISATSTLPINDVIKGINDSEEQPEKKDTLKTALLIAGISVVALAIIVGLVFLGIWAFGGK